MRLGHIRILYKAPTYYVEPQHTDYTNRERLYEARQTLQVPTDYLEPQQTIQSPDRLYEAPI